MIPAVITLQQFHRVLVTWQQCITSHRTVLDERPMQVLQIRLGDVFESAPRKKQMNLMKNP